MARRGGNGFFGTLIALFLATVIIAGVWKASGGTLEGLWSWASAKGQQAKECVLNKGECLEVGVPDSADNPVPSIPDATGALQLDSLRVDDSASKSGYERSEWKHWEPYGRSCWDSREESLYRHGKDLVLLDSSGRKTSEYSRACAIKSGVWVDPYNGQTETNPSKIDIDHIVSLNQAYIKGGHSWSAEKRKEFANDVDSVIVPSTAKMNRSKGASTPLEWQPPTPEGKCYLYSRTVEIYLKYDLSVSTQEKEFLSNELAKCS